MDNNGNTLRRELKLLRDAREGLDWFNEHYAELVEHYDNKFIAIKNKAVVASSANLDDLLEELRRKKINPAEAVIKYLTRARATQMKAGKPKI
ncbi:MAG: DUF5678 domain-containing protein [candidate division WOR-3 bacterium]